MPHPKTTLRVAMAAVAAPGIIAGMAAPAAHAAELAPSVTPVAGHVSDAQHTSLSGLGHRATSTVTSTKQSTAHQTVDSARGDLTTSHLLEPSNTLNGKSMSV